MGSEAAAGRARVVDEARNVALARGVDDLVLVERHEVHVVEAAQLLFALLPRLRIDHLAHVLDDELALAHALLHLDAPPLVRRLEDLQPDLNTAARKGRGGWGGRAWGSDARAVTAGATRRRGRGAHTRTGLRWWRAKGRLPHASPHRHSDGKHSCCSARFWQRSSQPPLKGVQLHASESEAGRAWRRRGGCGGVAALGARAAARRGGGGRGAGRPSTLAGGASRAFLCR